MPTETACLKCGGTGWVIRESANLSGAEACDCRFEGRSARMEDRAQIPPLYRKASFENFSVPGSENPIARSQLTQVYNDVLHYVRVFNTLERPGLLLMGAPGSGKTHLAVAAMRKIMAEWGREGVFCDYQNLLDRIRSGYDVNSNSSDKEAYRLALDADVLLLDDLGAHRVTDWVEDTITSIITYRCNNRKALIATTNLTDGSSGKSGVEKSPSGKVEYGITLVDRIGARARSRLSEMCKIIPMPLIEDYRVRKARSF